MTRPRVVVTGVGWVTPIGAGAEVWDRLLAGVCGTGPVRSFDASKHTADRGAEIHAFDPAPYFRRLAPGEVGRASQLAVAAARLAVDDAGLDLARLAPERVAVAMGTTSGEPREVERFDDRWMANELDGVRDDFAALYPCHSIAVHVAAELEAAGPNAMLPAACAAGSYAIAHGLDLLRAGRADVVLAGGADAFSRITYSGFSRLGAIAADRCQPFDRHRKGMIPGEGAAVLVLESFEGARRRGARIYAEVTGYGLSCDAHHMTAAHPGGDGAARAMRTALEESGLGPDDVDYVSAHGTGTPTNDRLEAIAFRRVFGERASRLATSSIKSMIGHTMGAASAIEGAVCALAVATGRVPPTIHFEEPDPDIDLDCVPNEAREMPVRVAMNNAYAFGGANASVIFREARG